jgi:hypothetical protein
MQTHVIVARLLQSCLPFMHAARWQALHDVTLSAVSGRALTLTTLRSAPHISAIRGNLRARLELIFGCSRISTTLTVLR